MNGKIISRKEAIELSLKTMEKAEGERSARDLGMDESEKMRQASGRFSAREQSGFLISFFYLVLREGCSPDCLERAIRGASQVETVFTNGWLASYASYCSNRFFKRLKKTKTQYPQDLESLSKICEEYRKQGKTIVWTNGCFDIFHAGHVESLRSAASLGDILIVGLNSDESIKNLKGPNRPVQPQGNRAAVLLATTYVDHVVIFGGERCAAEILALKPDIYAQGEDYTFETLDKQEVAAVEEVGAKIEFLPLKNGISTSSIIEKSFPNRNNTKCK